MFTILIQEKGGEQRRMVFNKPEVTIGRVQGNDIVLPKGNVSKRHARIVLKDGKFIIVDLKSTNGTYVNGRKITSPLVVKDSDKIYIGDFIVGVDEAGAASEGDGAEAATAAPGDRPLPGPDPARPPRPTEAQPLAPAQVPGVNLDGMGTMGPGMAGMGPPPGMAPGLGAMNNGANDRTAAPPPIAPPITAPGPAPVRPGPPRPAPGPAAREPVVPSAGNPPSDRRPAAGRPGGTVPPPMSPIPPLAGSGPNLADAPPLAPPAPAIAPPPMMARPEPVAPMPLASPAVISPRVDHAPGGPGHAAAATAQVVPMTDKKRGLVGAGAKRIPGRSVSLPNRRGVHLDPLDPKTVKMLDLQSNILERLRAKLDLDKVPMERLHEEDLWQRAERATIDLVETLETSGELPKYIEQDALIKESLNEALALGPLEDLLADDQIDEIIIDRRDRVVVGKNGVLRGSGRAFSSDDVFEKVVKRLVAEAGAVIDEARPLVDLRMRDGTRLTAAVSPVAARGACLVLKKPMAHMPRLADLVTQGALTAGMADFLATCVTARRNILVCGGPASGKTTIAGALAAASPPGERVVSVEEIAELSIARDEWIQLETRASSGRNAEINLGHLLETALRLAPDRLIVGEVRGHEALPLVQGLCASIDGAVVAVTGEGANAALGRIAMLARIAAPGADAAVRELVAQAFEIVVHVTRWSDGSLRVVSIEEVVGVSEAAFDTHVVFQFQNNAFAPTGNVPRFYAELEARGIPADQAVFR